MVLNSERIERTDNVPRVDMAHASRLSPRERAVAMSVAEDFLVSQTRNFNQLYLHLDVEEHKEKTRGVPAYRWRALLMTDRGRYYCEDSDFGAAEGLKTALDTLKAEIDSRLGRLDEASRGSTIGI
jgi:hypothetical protein